MTELKAGNKVQMTSREVTPEDEKSGLYYSYFGGLTGVVDTVYNDGTVCVDVDLESLSPAARDRHLAMQESERKKWLEGLSGEARNRLTPEQKQLKLSYKILASKKDVEPLKGGKPSGGKQAEKATEASADEASPSAHKGPARAPEPEQGSQQSAGVADSLPADDDQPAQRRVSADDLTKAEEEYLRSLQPNG